MLISRISSIFAVLFQHIIYLIIPQPHWPQRHFIFHSMHLKPRQKTYLLFICVLLAACHSPSQKQSETVTPSPRVVDHEAMQQLCGIWVDNETESVAFMVRADSVFYPDTLNLPSPFTIIEDTLFLSNQPDTGYPILLLTENRLEYENLSGDIVTFHRSYEPDDSLLFLHREYVPILLGQLVKRDTIAYTPDGRRLHLYINVNPTRMRVLKTTYTDEGMAVENSYYDNIIHIAVYEGRNRLFSQDFQKRLFTNLIPDAFLEDAILSNMSFSKVTNKECHFHATVCEPEGASCYVVDIIVGFDGKYDTKLIEY